MRCGMAGRSYVKLRAGASIVAACVLLLGILAPSVAQAAPGDFGAIAYSESTRIASFGAGDSQESAVNASVDGCRSQGGKEDCRAFIWVENGHLSVARADGGSGTSFGIAWGTSPVNALKYAVQSCERYGGADCVEVFSARTSDTPDESPSARGGTVSNICPAVFFIGVRGSGETQTYGAQIEAFINRLYPKLTAAYGSNRVSNNYIEYPAVAVDNLLGQLGYQASVNTGRDHLVRALVDESARCGSTGQVFALAGYSQGAHVISSALAHLRNSAQDEGVLNDIASVTYFGDPLWVADAPFRVAGPGSGYEGVLVNRGLYGRAAYPGNRETIPDSWTRIASFCLTGVETKTGKPDPICGVPKDLSPHGVGEYVRGNWQGAHDSYKDVPGVMDTAAETAYSSIVGSSAR